RRGPAPHGRVEPREPAPDQAVMEREFPTVGEGAPRVRRRRPSLRRVLLVLVGAAALYAILLSRYGLGARPQRADVAIVFGSQVRPDGTPSPRLVARLETAAKL